MASCEGKLGKHWVVYNCYYLDCFTRCQTLNPSQRAKPHAAVLAVNMRWPVWGSLDRDSRKASNNKDNGRHQQDKEKQPLRTNISQLTY
ncbi:hypothetical protein VTH8203_04503 [Vibrio thalassae]|uniref:Uncharacterized protein n=2 Tax=Vibrio thalassae TaxID=1243014 RepID=A0A240ERB4_9VIBR|nr:hypothetical protein VTH8203_04503 [Vibrio thalassae]